MWAELLRGKGRLNLSDSCSDRCFINSHWLNKWIYTKLWDNARTEWKYAIQKSNHCAEISEISLIIVVYPQYSAFILCPTSSLLFFFFYIVLWWWNERSNAKWYFCIDVRKYWQKNRNKEGTGEEKNFSQNQTYWRIWRDTQSLSLIC